MSQWINPNNELYSLADSLKYIFSDASPEWDAITMATPLDEIKTGLRAGIDYATIVSESAMMNNAFKNSWLWISLAFALGGAWLLYKKIIHWQIPVALLGSLAIISSIFLSNSSCDLLILL